MVTMVLWETADVVTLINTHTHTHTHIYIYINVTGYNHITRS